MSGLKPTELTPVPGVVKPTNMANSRTAVQVPKAKRLGQPTDKPSEFYKSEDFKNIKRPSIENLRAFLENQRAKR